LGCWLLLYWANHRGLLRDGLLLALLLLRMPALLALLPAVVAEDDART
jgi:hypothetical protein